MRPSATAPEETTSKSRPSECSCAISCASAASHSWLSRPRPLSTRSEEPTLITMRRKSAIFGVLRDIGRAGGACAISTWRGVWLSSSFLPRIRAKFKCKNRRAPYEPLRAEPGGNASAYGEPDETPATGRDCRARRERVQRDRRIGRIEDAGITRAPPASCYRPERSFVLNAHWSIISSVSLNSLFSLMLISATTQLSSSSSSMIFTSYTPAGISRTVNRPFSATVWFCPLVLAPRV